MSWSSVIKGALNQVKDSGASAAISRWLARELEDYGQLLDFQLNTAGRTVELRVHLKGERDPISVQVDGFDILSEAGRDYVVVRNARASREWVNAVLRNYLINKKHPIPQQYGGLVKMLMNE